MKKKTFKVFLVIAIIAFAACAVAAAMWYVDNRMPAFRSEGVIRIYPETTEEEIIADIDSLLQPKSIASIRRVIKLEDVAGRKRNGQYRFDKTNSARYLARAITLGWQNPVKVTISGSLRTKKAVADKLAANLMLSSQQLLDAMNDSLFLTKYGTTPSHIFEFILPDTYEMYWSASAKDVFDKLKNEYDSFWNEKRRQAAAKQGLTPEQVSILASIVAEESNKADEYPKIASVYLNRLKRGMKLQACPTVCYIYGYSLRRVLYRHLSNPSPYNTYINDGLPPTPICVPGKEHINAVLHPDPVPYLYFCADPSFNGRNVFSKTYIEHSVNANAYRRALDDRQAGKNQEAAITDTQADGQNG